VVVGDSPRSRQLRPLRWISRRRKLSWRRNSL